MCVEGTSRLSSSPSDSDPVMVLVKGVWERRCFGDGVLSFISQSPSSKDKNCVYCFDMETENGIGRNKFLLLKQFLLFFPKKL